MKTNKTIWIYIIMLLIVSSLVSAIPSNISGSAPNVTISVDVPPGATAGGSVIRFNATYNHYYINSINYTSLINVSSAFIINLNTNVTIETSSTFSNGIAYFSGSTLLSNNTNYFIGVNTSTGRYWTNSLAQYPRNSNNVTWNTSGEVNLSTSRLGSSFTDRILNVWALEYTPILSNIIFINPTPGNNSVQFYTNNSFIINTTIIGIGGIINTTHNVYYANGTLFQSKTNTSSANTSNIFTNLSVGRYYYNASFTNNTYINNTETRTIYINATNSILNITARNITNVIIQNFSVYVRDLVTLELINYSTTTGSIFASTIIGRQYNITTDGVGYALNYSTKTIGSSIDTLNVTLYPNNAVNLTIRNESSGAIIFQNESITFAGDLGLIVTSTMNGTRIFSGFTADNYTVSATTTGFNTRYGRVNIYDRSYSALDIYLNSGTYILFNFKTNTGTLLPGVVFNVYRYVNGTRTLVEQRVSDISGVAQVSLETVGIYEFTTYLNGYNNYSFSLNPVLFTSYDVILTATSSGADIEPSVVVTFTPTNFYRFQNVNFNIQFVSQYDSLTSYNYTVTYPGGTVNGSGTSPHGQSFNNQFNLGQATSTSTLTVFYYYNLSNGLVFNRTLTYPIIFVNSNRTWVSMGNQINTTTGQDTNTGYYVGERIIIVTLVSIIMFGVGWSIGGGITGLVFALIPIMFFINTGFVPKQLYYVTITFIIFYIISRGSDS